MSKTEQIDVGAIIDGVVTQVESESKEKPMSEHFKLVRVAGLVASICLNPNVNQGEDNGNV